MEEDSFDREENDDDSELDSGDEAAAYSKVTIFFGNLAFFTVPCSAAFGVCCCSRSSRGGIRFTCFHLVSLLHTALFL